MIGVALVLLAALAVAPVQTRAQNTVQVKWSTAPVVKMSLTPNYYSGFGAIKATFGTPTAPQTGPDATLDGGSVDFGPVLAGTAYLYKYAVHVNVQTNDPGGFYVYGEGAADFYNTADSTTTPISQTLYFLNSTSGTTPDTNTGFSPGLPFQRSGGMVSNNGQFTMPSITYGGYPAPINVASTMNGDLYYDYQLKTPPTATGGLYYVWIVYTVVPR